MLLNLFYNSDVYNLIVNNSPDKKEAVIKDGNQERFIFDKGEDINVPCKPTHPDVVISLKRTTQLTIEILPSVSWTYLMFFFCFVFFFFIFKLKIDFVGFEGGIESGTVDRSTQLV